MRLTRRNPPRPSEPLPELWLDFDDRQKRRLLARAVAPDGHDLEVSVQLERVETPLEDGELLGDEAGSVQVRVRAKAEPLLACTGDPLALVRAAYHLGNRHARVQVTDGAVLTPADPVMAAMLRQLGLEVHELVAPFVPEIGAYHHHGHGHGHDEAHHHGHGAARIHRFVMRP